MFDPKKLGEEADQLIQELNQQKAVAEAEVPAAESGEEQPVEDTAEAIAQDEVVAQTDDQGTEVATELDDRQDDADLDAVAELRKQLDAADQKWRVLQGMINKKDQELEAMRELFAQVSVDNPQKADAPAADAPLPQSVTEKDVEDYGADLIDLIKRASADVAAATTKEVLRKVEERLKPLEGTMQTVEQTTAKTAQGMFFDALGHAVPDWQQLNTDEAFLSWLDEPEPFTGQPRLQLLQDAVGKQDVARAAAFFNTYKSQTAPAGAEVEPQEELESPAKAKLASKVAPGRARAAAQKPTSEKIQWDRKAIAKLYDDKRAGRISAKEFDRLERDLFAAQTDGRIAV